VAKQEGGTVAELGYPAGCQTCADLKTTAGKAAHALSIGWPLPEELLAVEARIKVLEETLREVDGMLDAFPAGVDEQADANDPSPEDAESHTAGLIRQLIREALC
jgi:hypothetical protein